MKGVFQGSKSNVMSYNELVKNSNFTYGMVLKNHNVSVFLLKDIKPNYRFFIYHNGILLFEGNEYKPSPYVADDPVKLLADLLFFHVNDPQESGSEYGKEWNDKQLEWLESSDCQEIEVMVHDITAGEEHEYYQEAVEYFTSSLLDKNCSDLVKQFSSISVTDNGLNLRGFDDEFVRKMALKLCNIRITFGEMFGGSDNFYRPVILPINNHSN